MYRVLKVLAASGVVLSGACGDSSRISAELQNDLALAAAGADLELASRTTDQTRIVGAVERTTPPSRAIASSARAPRPRRSPTPRIPAAVQQESEIVQEPEVAAEEVEMPVPAPVQEAPVQIAASTRPRAVEPTSAGAGPSDRGSDWGTIIGIAGAVVIRGGGVGEDRCIPPGSGRGRSQISINQRFPQPRGRGTERVVVMGGRTGGRQVVNVPSRPRDISNNRPPSSPSMGRSMPSGGSAGSIETIAREGRSTASGDSP